MQVDVVRLERCIAHRFHHRMTAALDAQAGFFLQLRLRPVQRLCTFGEGRQHVEFAEAGRATLERFQMLGNDVEQAFVQQFFTTQ
ncbi:hypothetical protein D3C81_2067620 [compost metagenome]